MLNPVLPREEIPTIKFASTKETSHHQINDLKRQDARRWGPKGFSVCLFWQETALLKILLQFLGLSAGQHSFKYPDGTVRNRLQEGVHAMLSGNYCWPKSDWSKTFVSSTQLTPHLRHVYCQFRYECIGSINCSKSGRRQVYIYRKMGM